MADIFGLEFKGLEICEIENRLTELRYFARHLLQAIQEATENATLENAEPNCNAGVGNAGKGCKDNQIEF